MNAYDCCPCEFLNHADDCPCGRHDIPPVSVPGEGNWSWSFMVRQYPKRGPAGMSYSRIEQVPLIEVAGRVLTTRVDSLMYRNSKGRLVGILSRFPDEVRVGSELIEAAGNVSVWVDPKRRRRGIATRLLAEADRRWSPDWAAQTYTEGGRALIVRYLTERP